MVMIGEESNERDRPIYLQIGDGEDFCNSFWYVIEEKEDRNEEQIEEEEEEEGEEEEEEEEEEEIDHKKKKRKQIQDDDRKNICVLKQSETDEIRELRIPNINSFDGRLVVFNSRIYLIGGFVYQKNGKYPEGSDGRVGQSRKVFYLDTNNPDKGWLSGPSLNVRREDSSLSVAALENSNSGIFIAFGKKARNVDPLAELLDDSHNGYWWPAPPIRIDNAKLLAVTDTKVYMHGDRGDRCSVGLSFDLQNYEWNIFDHSFHGDWFPGVVLDFCSNSYLFLFGLHSLSYRLKSTPPIRTEQLWVYDFKKCTWLPRPVQGLPEDGTFLPDPKENPCSAYSYLLQMRQRNKLALVWSIPLLDPITKIHCTKFFIRCTSDSDSQHPIFSAQVVSSGSYHVTGGCTLFNCAASLYGNDKEFGILEEWDEN